MKVGEASPGQVLFASGRKALIWRSSLSDDEKRICDSKGFRTAVLLPAWSDGSLSSEMRKVPDGSTLHTLSSGINKQYVDCLLYLGPTYLSEAVGGLKKWHLFLVDGMKMGLEGYEFRHLSPEK